jgi:hypothetical protein
MIPRQAEEEEELNMSAGSAFASGVRAGQNIWNSAVQNAMAGKRMDMLKTQFQFEQTQRKKSLDDQLASQTAKDKFVDYLPAAVASGEIDLSTPEGMEHYSNLKSSVEPTIMRDPATWKQYENFSKQFELREGYPVFLAEQREILITGRTWDRNNLGNPRPQIKDFKTGELVDDNKLMADENLEDALKKEVERKRQLQEALYGGGALESLVISGALTSGMPKEVQAPVIIARQKRWAAAVKGGDTDTIIGASNVHTKVPSDTATQMLGKYKFTLARLGELNEQLKVVGDTGPIVGIFRSANPWDVKAQLLKAQITKIIPGLARGVFGEVGVLTDQDVALYAKTLGTLTSPEEINELLTSAAIKMISNSYEDKLKGMAEGRVNVSGYLSGLIALRNTANELLGIEEPETPIIEVENLPQSGAVGLTDDQAAAARAAAGPDGRVKVRETGTDIIREINVNPPTEETVEEAPAELVPAPAPRPDKSLEDFNVWRTKHLQDFPPLNETEAKDNSAERRKWEARIELFNNRLAELVDERPSFKAETSEEKKLKTAIAKAEAALKKL